MDKRVLVIIPAYNEEKSISQVVSSISKVKGNGYIISYVVVNDCSRDCTADILQNERKTYISLPVNLGIGGGMQCGYMYALENGYDIAVQMDGDGQHDAHYLNQIIEPILKDEADLTIGSRFIMKEGFQSSQLRRIGINFLSFLIRIVCGQKIKDVTSGFRAANKKTIQFFAQDYAQDYPEPESIVRCAKRDFRICEVPVIMKERLGGTSSISPIKSVYYMLKVSIGILFASIC